MTYKILRQSDLFNDAERENDDGSDVFGLFDPYESDDDDADAALIDDDDLPWEDEDGGGEIVPIEREIPGADWLRLPNVRALQLGLRKTEKGNRAIHISCVADFVPHGDQSCCPNPHVTGNGFKILRRRDLCLEPETPTWLHIKRQRFTCKTCRESTYGDISALDEHRMITRRLRAEIIQSTITRSYIEVSRLACVELTLVRRIWKDLVEPRLVGYEPNPPRVLGVDEVVLYKETRFVCMDLENNKLLDIFRMSDETILHKFFRRLADKGTVESVCLDMSRNYASKIKAYFPCAEIVVDRFHVVQLANEAFQSARIAYSKKPLSSSDTDTNAKTGLPFVEKEPDKEPEITDEQRRELRNNWRLLLANEDKLTNAGKSRLEEILSQHPRLKRIRHFKIEFLRMYEFEKKSSAETHYANWRSEIRKFPFEQKALEPLTRIMTEWGKEIFAFHNENHTNGRMERMNRSIRAVCRTQGFMEPPTLRAKVLLALGALPNTPSGERIGKIARGPNSPFGRCRPKRKACAVCQARKKGED